MISCALLTEQLTCTYFSFVGPFGAAATYYNALNARQPLKKIHKATGELFKLPAPHPMAAV